MELKYPIRSDSHVAESRSVGLLQAIAPETWILREVSERDYGVDCYIELSNDKHQVTGDLVLVQLKSKIDGFEWKMTNGQERCLSHPIKTSTVNYWVGLPVPIFLFEVDLSCREIYFVSIERQIRKDYQKISTQKTITFVLNKLHCLSEGEGLVAFNKQYLTEKRHENLAFHLASFICQIGSLPEFVRSRQMYDSFLELEAEDFLQFRLIHETCRKTAEYLNVDWNVDTWDELMKKDKMQWKHSEVLLHESTLDYSLRQIEPHLASLAREAVSLISDIEGEYWRSKDHSLYQMCCGWEVEESIKFFESRVGK
ncbi:DUF4365 domain-containing protein [Granulosicoccus sp.]|nr:DUF4365 domain-containing protein [Granulosicoccus sp.]MDB4223954.1 DUF4365 domain-containing protein [Granulosicoccus sp.]